MERVLSAEERIRRAEEIYARRRLEQGIRVPQRLVNSRTESDHIFLKKLMLQILISAIIYFIMYLIKTENFVFSEAVLSKTKEILKYNVNVSELYEKGKEKTLQVFNYINSFIPLKQEEKNEGEQEDTNGEEEKNNTEDGTKEETENGENVGIGGGGEETNKEQVAQVEQQPQAKSQMEQDAEYIKQNYNLIMPITGTVTSRFGTREPNQIVSANHTGIDIGAKKGTEIKSSMEGEVELVTEDEYYGKYLKVRNGELNIIYAHCDKILVSQEAKVKQGEVIATVGVTGRTTGPHLHFEVKRDNRLVNPEMILDF